MKTLKHVFKINGFSRQCVPTIIYQQYRADAHN